MNVLFDPLAVAEVTPGEGFPEDAEPFVDLARAEKVTVKMPKAPAKKKVSK